MCCCYDKLSSTLYSLAILLTSHMIEHGKPIQAPESLFPYGTDEATLEKGSIQQTEQQQTETPQIKLDPSENPLNWPARKKWSSTVVVVLMTTTITFCSSIHAAAITGVAESFGCSTTVSTLGVTTFLLGFATGPLLFAPLSEVWGRTLVFRITFFLFFCFNIGCALAPNIAALLILRFLAGFFGSPTSEYLHSVPNVLSRVLTVWKSQTVVDLWQIFGLRVIVLCPSLCLLLGVRSVLFLLPLQEVLLHRYASTYSMLETRLTLVKYLTWRW